MSFSSLTLTGQPGPGRPTASELRSALRLRRLFDSLGDAVQPKPANQPEPFSDGWVRREAGEHILELRVDLQAFTGVAAETLCDQISKFTDELRLAEVELATLARSPRQETPEHGSLPEREDQQQRFQGCRS